MSDKEYLKMTANVLKEELKKRGLDQTGKKADLVSRLEVHDTISQNEMVKDFVLNSTDSSSKEKFEATVGGGEFSIIEEDSAKQGREIDLRGESDDAKPIQDKETKEEELGKSESSIPPLEIEDTAIQSAGVEDSFLQKGPSDQKEVTLETGGISEAHESMSNVDSSDTTGESSNMSSVDDDLRISNLFGIEMKRERDAFQLKWYGKKFLVPFIGEIIKDLAIEVSQRSFAIKSITMEDMQSSCFQEVLFNAVKFLLDFQENVLEPTQHGYAKFVFKDNEDCMKFKESLKIYNKDLLIENLTFEDHLAQQFLNKDAMYYKGTIIDRLLYVGNLPCDVTECTVRNLFPDALRVIFPPLKDLDKGINTVCRYVYVEYPTSDDVVAIVEKCKDMKLNENKLFVIKAICVRKEKFGLLTDTLRSILLDKVRKMRKIQKNPWNKSRQEMQEIDKTISLNLEKLAADSKHRRSWNMELGALDETRLDQNETEKIDSISERGRGHRGGTFRGGSSRTFDSRRGHSRSSGFSNNRGWSGYYGSAGYTNSSYNQNSSGGYGSHDIYFNKRKSNDNFGGDWKRGRYY